MAAKYDLNVVLTAEDRVTAPLRAINARLEKINEPFVRINNQMRTMVQSSGLGRVAGALGNVGTAAVGAARSVAGLGVKLAGVTGLVGGGLFALAKSAADAGDEAAKSAQRAGVSIAAWQEYAYAASLADVSNEQLLKGFGQLSRNLVQARSGSKEMARWFELAGLNTKEMIKLAPDEVMSRVAGQVATMPDGIKKTSIAMGIFGKAGADLIPLLNSGADGLKEAREEAHRLGLVFDNPLAHGGEHFNDNLTRLSASVKGLKYAIGFALLSALEPMLISLREWIIANRQLIASKVVEWVERFKVAWPGLRRNIVDTFGAAKEFVTWANKVADSIGGWRTGLIALGGIMAIDTVAKIATLMGSLRALSVALASSPAGMILLGGTAALGWLAADASKHAQQGQGHGAHGEKRFFGSPARAFGATFGTAERAAPFNALAQMQARPVRVIGATGAPGASGAVDINVKVDAPEGTKVRSAGRGNFRIRHEKGRLMPESAR